MVVTRLVTSPTREEFVKAFFETWRYSEGRPSLLAAALLYAQFAFETGRGKYCYCWNLGNVRKGSWTGDVFELPTAWEIINGARVVTGGYFRAFGSLAEGMDHHLQFLSSLSRYDRAFQVLVKASALACNKSNIQALGTEIIAALKAGGYFTGPLEDYTRGEISIASEFVDLMPDLADEKLADTNPKPQILTPDYEFAGWGSTNVNDIFGRWYGEFELHDKHTAEFLAYRYDRPEKEGA